MKLEFFFYCNEAVLKIGRQHLRAWRWREAETLATGWLKRQSESGDALALRGLVCLANGHTTAAEGLMQSAVTCDPHSGYAYLALAQLYLYQKKTDEALLALRWALTFKHQPMQCRSSELEATPRMSYGPRQRRSVCVQGCNGAHDAGRTAVLPIARGRYGLYN
ncbi:tetratricopeptide repeat protein [Polaromonas sp.]|uniref:tetratricopeptide repeat protein n=1 Tax=Polaromonas sp. TaxID=1869339 RepID=UPI0037CC467C